MTRLYFAYGSNLKLDRMQRRVPSARALGPGRLLGRSLALDKMGADGSGKANLAPAAGGCVWGALYEIDTIHWPDLDRCEPGYRRESVQVAMAETTVVASTYVSRTFTADPPLHWYKRLIVEGAREHGLPAEWIAFLEQLPAHSGPERA